jgi:hypothetical protein
MQNEGKKMRFLLRSAFCVLTSALMLGCASSSDRTTRIESRPMTQNDTPFGGGFPPSHQANGDPFNRAPDRTIIGPRYGADNGAPETRVGSNGDSRLTTGDGRISK